MPPRRRTAEIASLVAGGEPTAAIAARYGITARRVRAIAAATGNAPARPGRRPTGAATHHTARGRALLAHLVADAAVVGVEPEAYLARARSWALAERDDLARLEDARREARPMTDTEAIRLALGYARQASDRRSAQRRRRHR